MPATITGNQTGTVGLINVGTVQTPSGVISVEWTGLPSATRRITVCFGGLSLTGTADYLIQLGTSSGYETTGYLSASEAVAYTAGFGIRVAIASWAVKGTMTINLLGSNIWCMSTNTYLDTGTTVRNGSGTKTMGGTVDRIRIISSNSSDTFDAGSVNILYE
jgi:hypothetical protein